MKNPNYRKPNMAALKGKWGKNIIMTIRNTPKPDLSELEKRVKEREALILAAKQNGTF